jgi:hypothetical protein
MKTIFKAGATALVLSTLLGGCAVYQPAPVYSQYGQPVYVQPAPVYVESPIHFGLNFGYWGGGRHRWGGHHH